MRHLLLGCAAAIGLFLVTVAPAAAGEANVIGVEVSATGENEYRFDVTIRSNDTGWEHYADAFEILSPDGTLLGRRVLYHPHEDEQPFTRSLHDVRIPAGIDEVTVRARHTPAGYDGETMTVPLPRADR